MKALKILFVIVLCAGVGFFAYRWVSQFLHEREILRQMVSRLEADSRVAEVLVTNVRYDEEKKKTYTTIKFLEYDVLGKPLEPKYFTFSGTIIQFQSLVIRFDDVLVRGGDKLKGKSAYLFWKVFMLDGKNTEEYTLTPVGEVPAGYEVGGKDPFEQELWENFWDYALKPEKGKKAGIKNAQIEAPGTMFIPGNLYTIKIEHDGGLRIDVTHLPEILRGEKIPQ